MSSAYDKQEGGDHYKGFTIQPGHYVHVNGLGFYAGCVVKRMTRYKLKAGAEDLRKAIHEIQLILEEDYNIKSKIDYFPQIELKDIDGGVPLPSFDPNIEGNRR